MQIDRKGNGSHQRQILIGMIIDPSVLGRIAHNWVGSGLFDSPWSNLIGSWCCEYYENYGKAPRKAIVGLFQSWAETARDKETVELIERFLTSLSGEYKALAKESNSSYVLDLASSHFNKVKLEKLSETIQGCVDTGDLKKGLKLVDNFSRLEVTASDGVDVLQNKEAIMQAIEKRSDKIIKYPGALGDFFGDVFSRDSFVAFEGPEKRGKSFWLIDVAWRAMEQGNRVAFFAAGDMTEPQMYGRFLARAAKRPFKATEPNKPVFYPTSIEHDPDNPFALVQREERHYGEAMTTDEAYRAVDRIIKKRDMRESLLRMSCDAAGSLTVKGILAKIQNWDRTGWGVPDVIVIDYADILAAPSGIIESREQINAVWMGLRNLSQTLHCCLVTASQTDAESYDAETISMGNFSGSKTKNAHVTAMIGINQTSLEKDQDLQRLNLVFVREAASSDTQCVHVAGCRSIANPAILSTF